DFRRGRATGSGRRRVAHHRRVWAPIAAAPQGLRSTPRRIGFSRAEIGGVSSAASALLGLLTALLVALPTAAPTAPERHLFVLVEGLIGAEWVGIEDPFERLVVLGVQGFHAFAPLL